MKALEAQLGVFDLIFCGKKAVDGEMGQVGPALAEQLGLPQITSCLEIQVEDGVVCAKKEMDEGIALVESGLPRVITVTKPAWELRYATIQRKLKTGRAEIPVLRAEALKTLDTRRIGLKGSPTRVQHSFVPPRWNCCLQIQGKNETECAEKLYQQLTADGVL